MTLREFILIPVSLVVFAALAGMFIVFVRDMRKIFMHFVLGSKHTSFELRPRSLSPDFVVVSYRGMPVLKYNWIDGEDARRGTALALLHARFEKDTGTSLMLPPGTLDTAVQNRRRHGGRRDGLSGPADPKDPFNVIP